MNISMLIEKLEKIKNKYGNVWIPIELKGEDLFSGDREIFDPKTASFFPSVDDYHNGY